MVEGARLERGCTVTRTGSSNLPLSANFKRQVLIIKTCLFYVELSYLSKFLVLFFGIALSFSDNIAIYK